jgi:hypothetical protein
MVFGMRERRTNDFLKKNCLNIGAAFQYKGRTAYQGSRSGKLYGEAARVVSPGMKAQNENLSQAPRITPAPPDDCISHLRSPTPITHSNRTMSS